MNKKHEDILIDLYLSSDEIENLSSDNEIQASVKKGMALLAPYKKALISNKAKSFKENLKQSTQGISVGIEEIRKRFDRLISGDYGFEMKTRGLGYCRNSSEKSLTDDEKRIILQELGLLDDNNNE